MMSKILARFSASLVLLMVVFAAPTVVGQPAGALTPVKYQIHSVPTGLDAPLFVAKSRGLYAKEGLDVEILPGRTSQDAVNALIAGTAKIAASLGTNVILSADKGQRVVAIGARYGKNVFGLLVGDDAGIKTLRDVKSKRIIVPGATYEALLKALLKKHGVDPASNEYILIPNPSAMISTYAAGKSDAALTVVPWGEQVAASKRASRGVLFVDYGDPEPGYVFIALADTIKKEPDLLRRFMRATYEGFRLANADPKLAGEVTAQSVPGADAATARREFEAMRPYQCSPRERAKPFGPQSLDDWKDTVQLYREVGLINTPVDPANLFSNAVFEGDSTVSRERCPG
jgi:NitT/TauT family transport system substrate-binding protein